jgi:phenylacetate-CoA ligase
MAGLKTAIAYRRLLRDPWRPADEIRALQESRLRRLVRHACESHAFYRERFRRSGVRPDEIRCQDDLRRLPPLSKEELRRAIAAADLPRRCSWESTSGSSGTPLRVPFRPEDHSLLNLTWLRPLAAFAIPAHARILEITGPHNIRTRPRWYQRLGFWRRRYVSILEGEGAWLAALEACRPDVLWGYSGSLKLLARFIEERGGCRFRPRWVIGVSDLVDDECRERVRRAFAAPLLDLYGAAEAGCISWICPQCGEYHVNSDHLVLEFEETAAAADGGGPRRIFVTNLHSFAFPIIRYDIGDVGLPSSRPPRCGRGLPLMDIVAGRTDAVIVLPSGRRLSPLFFFAVMKGIPGLSRWRVVQEESGRIRVMVVPLRRQDFSAAAAATTVRAAIAEAFDLAIEIVAAVPDDAGGKQRSVVSRFHRGRDG